MRDKHVKALLSHPKVQAVVRNPGFQRSKSQDITKIATHPTFASLMQNPELASLIAELHPQVSRKDAA